MQGGRSMVSSATASRCSKGNVGQPSCAIEGERTDSFIVFGNGDSICLGVCSGGSGNGHIGCRRRDDRFIYIGGYCSNGKNMRKVFPTFCIFVIKGIYFYIAKTFPCRKSSLLTLQRKDTANVLFLQISMIHQRDGSMVVTVCRKSLYCRKTARFAPSNQREEESFFLPCLQSCQLLKRFCQMMYAAGPKADKGSK